MEDKRIFIKVNGKEHEVPVSHFEEDGGASAYAEAYKGATIRMRDNEGDYDIPLSEYDNAINSGLHPFTMLRTDKKGENPSAPSNIPAQSSSNSQIPQGNQGLPPTKLPEGAILGERPAQDEASALFPMSQTDVAKRVDKEANKIPIWEEEKKLDKTFKPKPVQTYDDIKSNIFNRYSLTQEGEEANKKIAEAEEGIKNILADEMYSSTAYKQIINSSAIQADKDKAIQALWDDKYQAKLEKSMQPYYEDYNEKVFNRYGNTLKSETQALDTKNIANSWDSIEDRIAQQEKEIESKRGKAYIVGPTFENQYTKITNQQDTKTNRTKARQVEAARSLMEGARKIMNAAEDEKDGTFIGGVLRGTRDQAFNLDNWTMGLKGLSDGVEIQRVLEKYEKGGKLDDSEKVLMDAVVANAATEAFFRSKLGRGYKAGEVTGASLPFMVDMLTGVAAVSSSTKMATKGLLKYIAENYTKNAAKNSIKKNLIKGAYGLTKGIGDTAIHTASFGAGRVAGDYINRGTGEVQFDLDNGKPEYAGRVGQETGAGAFAKAALSTGLETQSELVGEQFAPAFKMLGNSIMKLPGLKNIPASDFGKYIKEVASAPSMQTFREFARRAQFQGPLSEYAEEVYNNIGSTVIGDMTPEQLVDLDQNIDTFLGVGVMSAAFGIVGTGAFIRDKYKTSKEIKTFEDKMRGEIDFDRLKDDLSKEDIEGARKFVKETLADKSLTPEEKKEEIRYIANVLKEAAMNSAEDVPVPDEEIENNKAQIFSNFQAASSRFEELTPEEQSNVLNGNIDALDDKKKDIAVDFLAARKDFENYSGLVDRKVEAAKDEAHAGVEAMMNPDMKGVVKVNSSISSEPIYIVGGKIDFNEDGTVNPANSDEALYYTDDSGKRKMISPSSIMSLVDMQDADSYLATVEQTTEQQVRADEQAQLPVPEVGKQVFVNNQPGVISRMDSDGVVVSFQDRDELVPADKIQYTMSENNAQNEGAPEAGNNTLSNNQPVAEETTDNTIPTDDKGNLLYHKASIDATLADLNNGDLSPEEINDFASANWKEAQSDYEKLSNKAPKIGTNKAKYLQDKKAWEAQVQEARDRMDYWNDVQNEIKAQQEQIGDKTGQSIREMVQPLNAEELAAEMLASGDIKLIRDDYMRETGGKAGEARKMFGMFASKDKGGISIAKAGEALETLDREEGYNFLDQNDPNAGRNVIISVLSQANTRKDLNRYIDNMRNAQAEKEERAERENYENLIESTYHMNIADFEAAEEQAIPLIQQKYEGVNLDEFNNEYADQLNNYENGQGTSETGIEGGITVLPGETSIQGTGVEGSQRDEQLQQAGVESGAQNGTIQEGTFQSIKEQGKAIRSFDDRKKFYAEHIDELYPSIDDYTKKWADTQVAEMTGKYNIDDAIKEAEENLQSSINKVAEDEASSAYADEPKVSNFTAWRYIAEQLEKIKAETPKVDNTDEAIAAQAAQIEENRKKFDKEAAEIQRNLQIGYHAARHFLSEDKINDDLGKRLDTQVVHNDKGTIMVSQYENGSNVVISLGKDGYIARKFDKEGNQIGSDTVKLHTQDASLQDFYKRMLDDSKREQQALENIEAERQKVNTDPTDAQKEAGNYQKGHVKIDGYDVTIENPKDSYRTGTDKNGKKWSTLMHNDYGYIRGTQSVDGDHIDVFLSPNPTQGNVYVVDQVNPDGTFDEHKVMYGFSNVEEAKEAYLSNYSKGWKGLGTITEVSKDDFKKWIDSSVRKTKPFAEYKSITSLSEDAEYRNDVRADGMIIDKNGAPTVMYHGTDANLVSASQLETGHRRADGEKANFNGDGIEFTPDKTVASEYGKNILRANIILKKPYISYGIAHWDEEESKSFTEDLKKKGYDGIINYPSKAMRSVGADINEVIVFSKESIIPIEDKKIDIDTNNSDSYVIDKRFHAKKGTSIYAVKFKEQFDRDKFVSLKSKAKDFGGYYSSFGKGGFIFDNIEDAKRFGDAVTDVQDNNVPETEVPTKSYNSKVAKEDISFQTDEKAMMAALNVGIDVSPRDFAMGLPPTKHRINIGLASAFASKLSDRQLIAYLNKNGYKINAEEENALLKVREAYKAGDMSLNDVVKTLDSGTKVKNNDEEKTKAPAKPHSNLVAEEDQDKFAALKARLKAKMNNLNVGIDPELLEIGAEMAYLVVKNGTHKFAAFAKGLIDEVGDEIRPYLKQFYMATTSDERLSDDVIDDMDDAKTVRAFDIANFGKNDVDVMNTINTIAKEKEIEEQTIQINKENEQNTANTEAIAAEAETVVSQTTSQIEKATTETEVDEAENKINEQLENVDNQLKTLNYLDNIKSGARLVLKDGRTASVMMIMHSGEQVSATQFSKPRIDRLYGISKGKMIDFTPDKVDLDATIKLNEGKTQETPIIEEPADTNHRPAEWKDLKAGDKVMYKGEECTVYDFEDYGEYRPSLDTGMAPVIYEIADWKDISKINSETANKKGQTNRKSKKENVSSQSTGDLFGDLFGNTNINDNGKEEVQLRPGSSTSEREGGYQSEQNEPLGKTAGNEAEGPDRRGMGRRDRGDISLDTQRSGSVPKLHEVENGVKEAKNLHNNHAEHGIDYAPKGVDSRIKANLNAIKLMQELIESGKNATPEDMKVLRQFSGWGGLGKLFNDEIQSKELRELIGDEAYDQAVMSRNSAYYTPAPVIDALWDIAKAVGFKGGNILEGSAGIGNILGLMPEGISQRSNIHAVEIDGITGNILSLLYPEAKVEIQGFEATKIPNNSVDLAITNVPFVTGLKVDDTTGDKDLSRKFRDIHDFCIAKNVRKLRDGGIGIFITSSGTLDNSQKLRSWIINEGNTDVVGAFRLNNETFGGTGATSDIIVVRKRVNNVKSPKAIDVLNVSGERSAEYDTGDTKKVKGVEIPVVKNLSMDYNKYFIEHPENMGGVMKFGFEENDTFRPTSKALYPARGKDQSKLLSAFVNTFSDMSEDVFPVEEENTSLYEELGSDVKEGSMLIDKKGNLCIAQGGNAVPLDINKNKVKGHTKQECFNAYTGIKKAVSDVLNYQNNNEGDEGLKPLLDKLNKAYDKFVSTYGHFNKNTSISFLKNDIDFPSVFALETYKEKQDINGNKTQEFGKTDIFKKRVVDKEKAPEPKNVKDGIFSSIYQFGRIDIPFIAENVGKSETEVKQEILESGLGFENPLSKEVEVTYEYLSGNVREKLQQAIENNIDGEYNNNIKALENVIPMNIPAHLIEFSFGSSWIEPKLYEDYVKEKTDINVKFTNAGGTWFMKAPEYGFVNEKNRSMGVYSEQLRKTVFGHTLMEAAIQNKTITVSQTTKKWNGETETVTDKDATQACAAKIDEIRQDFKDWARQKMQSDPDMSMRIEKTYNEQFNNYVPKSIPDDFVPKHFIGQVKTMGSREFSLREHQSKAVIRGTTQPLMLAHEVGTGKTFTLISTAMEMRRLGTAKKPMIVVQNATVGQFVASAKALYPNAKVLTLEDTDRNLEGRKNFYAKIKYNDWDMIVVPQSVFEKIPDSEERQMAFIRDKIEEKMLVLEQMKEADNSGNNFITKKAEKEIEDLNNQLAELSGIVGDKKKKKDEKKAAVTRQNAEVAAREMLDRATDDVENFDDMGIDALLVDEAHEYKHLGFATAMQRGVKGVDPSYSKKSQGVFLKTQAVLEKNNGRNVIFATGTPISNTAAEIWTFMRYLMPADTMKQYDIYYFDDFVRNFGNIQQMLEFATNGKPKENNRFAGYVNLPELIRIWSSVADTVRTAEAGEVNDKIPEMEGGKAQDIYLPQTRALRSVMKFVKSELNRFDNMTGKEKKENKQLPLLMYGIAKAAAVDARLVLEDAEDDPNSKTNEAVRQTLRSLKDSQKYKGTVAIFADNYQNKRSGFNLYEDIRKKLIKNGVPEDSVVVMKSGMSIKKKLDIFNKVNSGEIRVILGSTFTLGTGVNIQERLHTLIHVDAPNRPMDYTQRNGRILRQGNLHKDWGIPVRVLRFGVEDSLDVTAYQRLKTKGAIADSIMNGKQMMANSMETRALEEEEDVFGDTVAQLSGSEYAMMKNQAEKDLRKYQSKYKQWQADQTYIHNQIPRLQGQIKSDEDSLRGDEEALDRIEKTYGNKVPSININGKTYKTIDDMADFFKNFNSKLKEAEDNLRKSSSEEVHKRELSVEIGDLEFKFTTVLSKEVERRNGTLHAVIKRKMNFTCPAINAAYPVERALLRNGIEEILNDVITGKDTRERINYVKQGIERNKRELEQIKEREGKPFQYEEELQTAKDRVEEYGAKMKEELAEKEKKYAEMDAEVKAADDVTLSDEDDGEEDERMREDEQYQKALDEQQEFEGKFNHCPILVIRSREDAYEQCKALGLSNEEANDIVDSANDERTLALYIPEIKRIFIFADKGSGITSSMSHEDIHWAIDELFSNRTDDFNALYESLYKSRPNDCDKIRECYSDNSEAIKRNEVIANIAEVAFVKGKMNIVIDKLDNEGQSLFNEILNHIGYETSRSQNEHPSGGRITDNYSGGYRENKERRQELRDKGTISQTQREREIREEVTKLSNNLHSPVEIISNIEEIPSKSVRERIEKGRKVKGWYDVKTGKVYIYLPNTDSAYDAQVTILHEIVAHKGLKQIFGKEYDNFCNDVFNSLDKVEQERLLKKHKSPIIAGDEYCASIAEQGCSPTLWQIIKGLFNQMLRKAGFTSNISDNEIKYLLWKSKNRLMKNDGVIDIANKIAREQSLYDVFDDNATDEDYNVYREVTDEELLNKLNSEPTIKVYRAMQLIDGKLYPPMAAKVNGKLVNPIELKKWEQSEEHPELADDRGYFILNKGNGTSLKARYNPYIHTSRTPLNDQFSSAQDRSNLVTVEVEIPVSELTSGYKAEKAKDAVGELEWKAGVIQSKLSGTRKVILTRYDKPVRIVSDSEVADEIVKMFKGKKITMPTNVVTPSLRTELEKRGIPFIETDNQGKPKENIRFRDDEDTDMSQELYNEAVQGAKFRVQEAYQDSMLALKKLQEVIAKESNSEIKSFEDAYLAENRLSSKNTRGKEVFYGKYFKPMEQEITNMMKQYSYDDIVRYVEAKHGLERNEALAKRDAENKAQVKFDKRKAVLDKELESRKISKADYDAKIAELESDKTNDAKEYYRKNRDTDYSGISSLFDGETLAEQEMNAKEYILGIENGYDTSSLWSSINKATKATLMKSYNSGLMSKDTYEKVSNMFQYYVPLRGWDEKVAADVYEYMNNEVSPVSPALKTAKGRSSIADDPFAVIGNMAESTILQGNRNLMKQAFYSMVVNHPTKVATIRNTWYVYNLGTEEWELSMPEIEETDSAKDIDEKFKAHEEHMKSLEESGLATRKANDLNIRYRITPGQKQEHMVIVKRGGQDQIITINGNPRAAQAINGLTNPEVDNNKFIQALGTVNRFMAANFTTRNPAFVLSNLSRDLIFAQTAVAAKESKEYSAKFFTNIPKTMAMIAKGLKGEPEGYFKEFLDNGGETGYMNLTNVDAYKKKIKADIAHLDGSENKAKTALKYLVDRLEDFNRWAEDVSRFNAYMTSRQMGRSIAESVNDAKEITVNFNKKGAGLKSYNTHKAFYTKENLLVLSAGMMKMFYLFFNAGVQSLANFGRIAKNHPVAFGSAVGGFMAAGALMPVVNAALFSMTGGDGDDPYSDLPDWVRRNNICIYCGGGKFITIPLPIELRAFYGLGDIVYNAACDDDIDANELSYNIINQFTELLPLNPIGGNGDIASSFMPDALKPFWQVYQNKDFTGKPIYKATAFNELDPEFKRVYKGTSGWLVDTSRFFNNITGGNDFKKGLVDINPAKIEHMYETYFGGVGKTINQFGKTIYYGSKSIIEGEADENLILRNVPVANRFLSATDEKSMYSGINKKYQKLVDEYEIMNHEVKGLLDKASLMNPDYLQQFADLSKTEKFIRYKKFETIKKQIDLMYKLAKDIPEENRNELMQKIIEIKRVAVEDMKSTNSANESR